MNAGRALLDNANARLRDVVALGAACSALLSICDARADDAPSPCIALKRIVAAAPDFAALSPDDGRSAAQPYGDDARCAARAGSYECLWTAKNASGADALQGVAADIASCLPDATHDQNSPTRQHFYLGAPAKRTQITASTTGAGAVKLVVSGNR
jgi:hypothetical protein